MQSIGVLVRVQGRLIKVTPEGIRFSTPHVFFLLAAVLCLSVMLHTAFIVGGGIMKVQEWRIAQRESAVQAATIMVLAWQEPTADPLEPRRRGPFMPREPRAIPLSKGTTWVLQQQNVFVLFAGVAGHIGLLIVLIGMACSMKFGLPAVAKKQTAIVASVSSALIVATTSVWLVWFLTSW